MTPKQNKDISQAVIELSKSDELEILDRMQAATARAVEWFAKLGAPAARAAEFETAFCAAQVAAILGRRENIQEICDLAIAYRENATAARMSAAAGGGTLFGGGKAAADA